MATKKYMVEMDETILSILKNSGQITVKEDLNEGIAPIMMDVAKPAVAMADVLRRYMEYIVKGSAFSHAANLPSLDDDTLSDSITLHLKDRGIDTNHPVFQEKHRKLYDMISKKFKIYG